MENKIQVVLAYYKRPNIVLNALNSLKLSNYSNWQLDFVDDSGDDLYKGTLFTLGLDSSKVHYHPTYDSDQQKIAQGGSRHGKFINKVIRESDSEIVLILCDDDALLPDYMIHLNEFYSKNPSVMWAYSKVKYYNPLIETYLQAEDNLQRVQGYGAVADLNQHTQPINPDCACDASQVSFRRRCFTEKEIWFPYPQTRNLDSAIYNKMYEAWGACYPTSTYGQCKGVFSDQLGCRTQNDYKVSIN